MIKKSFILISIVFLFHFPSLYSQGVNGENTSVSIQEWHQEKVFVHYNSSLLFAGESLYFQMYSRNALTNEFSRLSKMGYLELVNSDYEVVWKQIIELSEGAGQGEFFIPETLLSGNYKLIAYTRWMLDGDRDHIFKGDVVIINPYLREQKNILPTENRDLPKSSTEFAIKEREDQNRSNSRNFKLSLNKAQFNKREKVILGVQGLGSNEEGSVSVSVRKKSAIQPLPQPVPYTISQSGEGDKMVKITSTKQLPDLRGQLITGRIYLKDSTANLNLTNRAVGISIPGENFFLRIVRTKQDGNFLFNLGAPSNNSNAYLQVLGENKEKFGIEVDAAPSIDHSQLQFEDFFITREMENLIQERSIYNQIENSYFEVKRDSVLPVSEELPFFGTMQEIYNLDDFTRFPTLRETFVEIINFARIRRNASGNLTLDLTLLDLPGNQTNLKPLLIVDGLLIQDHEDIINYDARKIQSIGLLREKYYLGMQIYQGVFNVKTIEGEFYNEINKDFLQITELIIPPLKKEYFFPSYGMASAKNDRIPDFRTQLYWEPSVNLTSGKTSVEFYTSDIEGEYEIVINGFTLDGEPIHLVQDFKVTEI